MSIDNSKMKKVLEQLNGWCTKHYPQVQSVYDDCAGYTLQQLVYYLLGVVKENTALTVSATDEYNELYTFVHDYFDNLDVQDEINNKIDEMVKTGELSEIISNYFDYYTTPERFGAVGDGVHDDTNAFKQMLSSENSVFLLRNKYLITDTLKLKSNIKLYSPYNFRWDNNASQAPLNGCVIMFNPSTNKNMFEIDQNYVTNTYVPSIELSNIFIKGNEKANVCLNLELLCTSTFKNITITNFNTGIQINKCMRNVFKNVCVTNFLDYGVLFDGGLSTTQTFYDCYFGQSEYENCICLYINENNAFSVNFINTCFETTMCVLKTLGYNVIGFHECYIENIPFKEPLEPNYVFYIQSDSVLSANIINICNSYIQGNNNQIINNSFMINNAENSSVNITNNTIKIFKSVVDSSGTIGFINLYNNTEISTTPIDEVVTGVKFNNERNLVSQYHNSNSNNRYRYGEITGGWDNAGFFREFKDVLTISINSVATTSTLIGTFNNKNNIQGVGYLIDLTVGDEVIPVIINSNNIIAVSPVEGHTYVGKIVLPRIM